MFRTNALKSQISDCVTYQDLPIPLVLHTLTRNLLISTQIQDTGML